MRAAIRIMSCCDFWLPSQIVSNRLDPSEPTMAPSVLAA